MDNDFIIMLKNILYFNDNLIYVLWIILIKKFYGWYINNKYFVVVFCSIYVELYDWL